MKRRRFIEAAAAIPALAPLSSRAASGNVYTRLGLRPLINGMGTVTAVGGSIMPPEVVRAMEEASQFFVPLADLQLKVGERIAELVGVPAAMVTAGAASAITVATVACIARGDGAKLRRLPDTEGMPNEVIQQKAHICGYETQFRLAGAKMVVVETREELERAINPRTAMMFFLNKADPDGKIGRKEWIEVARRRGVPTFNDAAADVPPPERLSSIVKEGFDLVAFSGGKGLCGPQCSGLLLGTKELVDAGRPAISPHGGIGRGMKVGKEELIGLLAAVERFLKLDHAAEQRLLDSRIAEMIRILSDAPGVTAKREVPAIANEVPHLALSWDEQARGITSQQLVRRLMEGDPPIAILGRGPGSAMVSVWMMRGSEHRTVARRLRELFQKEGRSAIHRRGAAV